MTDAGAVTEAVLAWGVPRLRDLPWRATRDPWAVLVSEMMLQQTQVVRVIPKWTAFLERFPTPQDCAAAPLGDVLRVWQGLGYPRRAKHLHLTAQRVSEWGGFPATLEGMLDLPGIGPYTARAVLAFAFEQDVAVVDTNIARVHARLAGHPLRPKEVQHLADATLPLGSSWVWNQAVMDLGAVLCRPATPACGECPLMTLCAWASAGRPDPDPAIGSAGVSGRQAPFAGSDREARGRLLRALADAPVPRSVLGSVMGRNDELAETLTATLVAEGLIVFDDRLGMFTLPNG